MKTKLLLEGKEDAIVIGTLTKNLNLFLLEVEGRKEKTTLPKVEGKPYNGISTMIAALELDIEGFIDSDYERIGIVIDADLNVQSSWNNVRNELLKISTLTINIPQIPNTNGTICNFTDTKGRIGKIGIWVMPDNLQTGMLEDFVQLLVPNGNPLLQEAKTVVQTIKNSYPESQRFKDVHKAKAEIHTWLAWQDEPGTPMGSAINEKLLSTNTPTCIVFTQWLRDLFL